eukprot:TRINITY_DN2045_c0_g1_i1.p2 TRINITY_DN2045_c0_g1~~TRINITY_DN2045_c0_g1_i1.p2  ORF type:complete len:102 (-),score=21.12 TRINITY_DN2045_c0_g1_i1:628-933(-)
MDRPQHSREEPSVKLDAADANAPQSTAELTVFVQNLLQQMQSRFQSMSDSIISRIDEMGGRIDDLERSIGDLVKDVGVEPAPVPNSSGVSPMAASKMENTK